MKATAAKKTAVRKAATTPAPAKRSSKTKTKGALKAGGSNGYLFKMSKLTKVPAGTGYSTSAGGVSRSMA